MVIQGTTSGSIQSTGINTAGTLKCFSLYTKSGGAIVATIGIVIDGSETRIFNFNLAATGTATSSVYQETEMEIEKTAQIFVITSGSLDYYIIVE